MATERDDDASLWDMLTATRAVESFVKGRNFQEDTSDLMLRNLRTQNRSLRALQEELTQAGM